MWAYLKHCHHPWPVSDLLQVFAVDTVPERLELAREFGATPLSLAAPERPTAASAQTAERGAKGSTVPAEPAETTIPGAASKGAPEQHDVGSTTHVDAHTAAMSGGCVGGVSNGAEVNGALPGPIDGSGGSGGSSGAGAGMPGAAGRATGDQPPERPSEKEGQRASGARGTAASAGASVSAVVHEGGPGEPSSSAAGPHGGAAGVLAAVRGATGGRGADVVLEAVGSQAAVRVAYELIRPGGAAPTCTSCLLHASRSHLPLACAHGSWGCVPPQL